MVVVPQLVIFTGIPASGKSTFYQERFFTTHVRVNLDMLKTRHREALLVGACIAGRTSFVVDNTNLQPADRARYIPVARAAGFSVVGYVFQTPIADALTRNAERTGKQRVPDAAIRNAVSRFEWPTLTEGFDSLWLVRLGDTGFVEEPL